MRQPLLYSACWPNLRYVYYLVNHHAVTIELNDTYARQTFRSRYQLLSANGVLTLSVPVMRRTKHARTKEVEISYSERWQQRHWRAITSAYGKSAFFEFFEDDLRTFYKEKEFLLSTYNTRQLDLLKKILRLTTIINFSGSYTRDTDEYTDLRFLADPSAEVADETLQNVLRQPYFQTFSQRHGFVQDLSILDLLLNTGLNAVRYFRGNKL